VRSGGATKVDGSREVRSERRAARSVESVDGVALSSPEPAVRRLKREGVVCQRAQHGFAERLTKRDTESDRTRKATGWLFERSAMRLDEAPSDLSAP
jgi:hypothetical protein